MISMGVFQINLFAVLAATVLNTILCFVWYGALFAKPWTRAMGYDPDMRPDGRGMAKGVGLTLLASFATVWFLAFYLAGWRFIPGMEGMGKLSFGFNSALSVWLGFLAPVHLSKVVWERHSWKLFGINGGYHLIAVLLAGIILALWS